jgi:hypothetical protein
LQSTIIDSRRSNISSDVDAPVGEAFIAPLGDFARGQRRDIGRIHVYGDFATGVRSPGMLRVTGDFATGMRIAPRRTAVGDFATGMRTLASPVAIHDLTSAERALPVAA